MTFREKIDCIQTKTILEVTWTNCPEDVAKDCRKIWIDNELGNDHYFSWEEDGMSDKYVDGVWKDLPHSEVYPALHAYLKSRDITKCLIHYWW